MSAAHLESILNRLAQVTGYTPQRSGDEWRACCPVHEADGRSHTPSLSVREGDRQEVLMKCHAGCDYDDIRVALGLKGKPDKPAARRIVAAYSYCDEAGKEVRQKVRYEPKGFTIRHQDAAGQWVYKAGAGPAVLYRLPEVLAGIAKGQPIFLVEGEKDVDRLRSMGLIATTNIEGASEPGKKAKWRKEYTQQLTGAGRVVLIPDNDAPGRAHLQHIAQQLHGKVGDLRWLELPGLPEKGDVSDWFNQEHTREEFLALVEQAPVPGQEGVAIEVIEESPPTPSPRFAKVRVNVGELPEAGDEAEAALIAHQVPIYQRGDYLCRVATMKESVFRGKKQRLQQLTSLLPLDADHLLSRMNRLIHFERWSDRKNDYARCHAPRSVAIDLLSRIGEWQFPVLTGVVSAPTLRPDGSLLDQPGYDPATGLLFETQGSIFPPIPDRPTREQAQAALTFILQEVLDGFPFAESSDRAVALSAMLTALVRPALRTAPLHTFDAPHPGSGKSLLADVVAMVATGTTAKVMTFAREPEEMRKRVLSILLQGAAVVNLDNLSEPLQSDALCSVLTQTTYTERFLQQSRMVTVPTCSTWLATGNNLQVQGDMTRRCIPCRLDAQCEHPEEREFSRDLYDWIPEHRPQLVAAGLTILRAYLVAGRPKQPIKTLGGFEDWSGLVRSALIWLGEADPTAGRVEFENADPSRLKLRMLLLAWYATFKSAGATSKEAVAKANETRINDQGDEERCYPDLWEVLSDHFQDRSGNIKPQLIGEFIKKNSRRVEIGARFEDGDYGTRRLWKVAIVDQNRLRKFSDEGKQGARGARVQGESFAPLHPMHPYNPRSENFAVPKNDVSALVHHLKNGYKGCDTAALRTLLGDDEDRWQTAVDAALDLGLIRVAGGFWYAEEVRS
ncbi:MAG: hypothetical protein WAW42_05885 [Candidatus Competibacteraceae bacterium]